MDKGWESRVIEEGTVPPITHGHDHYVHRIHIEKGVAKKWRKGATGYRYIAVREDLEEVCSSAGERHVDLTFGSSR
jgi:hypothetical protein